jgi:hypothetical protein
MYDDKRADDMDAIICDYIMFEEICEDYGIEQRVDTIALYRCFVINELRRIST